MAEPSRPWRVDITGATIVRVLAAIVLVALWLRLWQWVLLLVVAAFLAVGLDPVVTWLEARRVRRGYGAPLVVLLLAGLLVAFGYFAGAELLTQGQMLGERLGDIQQEITRRIPQPILQMLPRGKDSGGNSIGTYVNSLGSAIVSGVMSIGIAFVLTVYLLIDGRRTFEWLAAFAPHRLRPRVRQTAVEARKAVVAYVRGNAITSAIAAAAAYAICLALGVPAALLLALLTGLFDFLPVVGVFLSAIPMIALAFTVSPLVGIVIAAFNVVYNIVETYYISPKVYGRSMRMSDLAVILAFIVGGELGGVVGALIALPFVAMYPAIESIWLADRLAPEALDDHRRIENSEEH